MTLPATMLEAEAVGIITHAIDQIADKLDSENGRQLLRDSIRERLAAGTISRMKVVEAAEAGHQDADQVLRELAVEYYGHQQTPPPELAAYFQRAILRPPASYPRGRSIADTWQRDVGIALLVRLTAEKWSLPRTRSHLSRKPGRLSACYLVSLALGRRGIMIGERQVEKIADKQAKPSGRLAKWLSESGVRTFDPI